MHYPHAIAPLAADYVIRAIGAGMASYAHSAGAPQEMQPCVVDGYVYFGVRQLVSDDELEVATARWTAQRREATRALEKRWHEEIVPELRQHSAWMSESLAGVPRSGLVGRWNELWARLARVWHLHFETTQGAYQALNDFVDLCETMFPKMGAAAILGLLHSQHDAIQDVEEDIGELVTHAQAHPSLAPLFDEKTSSGESAWSSNSARAFQPKLMTFLTEHGHLGQPFEDLTLPPWSVAPERLLAEIGRRRREGQLDPRQRRERRAASVAARVAAIAEELAGDPDRLARFESARALACGAGSLSETHNYWIDRLMLGKTHVFCRALGERLVAEGLLDQATDIFMLAADEISSVLREGGAVRPRVEAHRAELAEWSLRRPPETLGTPRASAKPHNRRIFSTPEWKFAFGTAVTGIGASTGVARGPVRVVLSPDGFDEVLRGDVVVCPSSNSSWVPIFMRAAAIVTDSGGVLSHAAVIAREFGVPSVVGTRSATKVLVTGQHVEVDGTTGEIRSL